MLCGMEKVMKGARSLPGSVTLIACISNGSDVRETERRERKRQGERGGVKDDEFPFQIIHNENISRPSDICTE